MPGMGTTGALLRRASDLWGQAQQWDQVIEECAELIVAIRHRSRERATIDQVAEEVADVIIMTQAARQMVGEAIVDRLVEAKLRRLEHRVITGERKKAKTETCS
jgi:phosphoribosyl-ATP pyrophosphohydrolase